MRESRTYGSVRGALSNERPYRVTTDDASQTDAHDPERACAAGRDRLEYLADGVTMPSAE